MGDRRAEYGEQPVAQKALNNSLMSTNRLGHLLENPAHQKVGFFLAKPVPRSAHTMPYGEKHSRVIGLLGLPTGPRCRTRADIPKGAGSLAGREEQRDHFAL